MVSCLKQLALEKCWWAYYITFERSQSHFQCFQSFSWPANQLVGGESCLPFRNKYGTNLLIQLFVRMLIKCNFHLFKLLFKKWIRSSYFFIVWMPACLPASVFPLHPLKGKYNPIITVILVFSESYHYLIAPQLHLTPSYLHSLVWLRPVQKNHIQHTQKYTHRWPIYPITTHLACQLFRVKEKWRGQ